MKTIPLSAITSRGETHSNFPWGSVFSAIFLTAGMLTVVQVVVERPLLLADRFFPGMGWIEIIALSLYAGFLTPKILNPKTSVRWRTILWLTFSVIFFSQLILGIFGFTTFLMSGVLHYPVPGLIVAGPIYRGENFFMPILFGSTLFFIGPAWCSYFCYLGGWDFLASQKVKRPRPLSKWRRPRQIAILVLVVGGALYLRFSEMPISLVSRLVALFGLGGLFIIIFLSRRYGSMIHCISYCPIGLVANIFGKISPFRIKIDNSCTSCGRCSMVCRYDALKPENIKQKKTGLSCTLCGDCINSCTDNYIHYSFPGLSPQAARTLFIVIVVSFHAVSIGVARI